MYHHIDGHVDIQTETFKYTTGLLKSLTDIQTYSQTYKTPIYFPIEQTPMATTNACMQEVAYIKLAFLHINELEIN